jgi:outer membrane protein assembly factor BamB
MAPAMLWADNWPQLGGPMATCISAETGINSDWAAHAPPIIWTFAMHDNGYAAVTIVDGTCYVLDHQDDKDILRALELATGKQKWESPYTDTASAQFGFSRAYPVYDAGKIYTFSRVGNANCFDASGGKILWSRNLKKDFNGSLPSWDYASSPIVDGNQVIYLPGGKGASVVALDKNTGTTIWKNGDDRPSHATPVVATINNVKQYVIFDAYGVIGVRTDNGNQLWSHQWTTQHDVNSVSPIVMGNKVFITSGYDVGCAMLTIDEKWKVRELWKNRELIGRTCNPILYQGYIYGTDETLRLVCLNPDTGMDVWAKEGFGARLNVAWKDGYCTGSGGIVLVDGTLFVVSELTKSMVAVKATPEGYQELGRVKVFASNTNDLFTSPSFSDKKLVVRDQKNIYCLDLSPTAAK